MGDGYREPLTDLVVNIKSGKKYDVYIGRDRHGLGEWGNPYTHMHLNHTVAYFKVDTRHQAIAGYEEYLIGGLWSGRVKLSALRGLAGKVLACWCRPQLCHGDILAYYAQAALSLGSNGVTDEESLDYLNGLYKRHSFWLALTGEAVPA